VTIVFQHKLLNNQDIDSIHQINTIYP
jgi:hypothetical protein